MMNDKEKAENRQDLTLEDVKIRDYQRIENWVQASAQHFQAQSLKGSTEQRARARDNLTKVEAVLSYLRQGREHAQCLDQYQKSWLRAIGGTLLIERSSQLDSLVASTDIITAMADEAKSLRQQMRQLENAFGIQCAPDPYVLQLRYDLEDWKRPWYRREKTKKYALAGVIFVLGYITHLLAAWYKIVTY